MGLLGGLSPEGSIAVGVVVGVISTSLQAIGLTLQRKSHLLEDEKPPYEHRRPPYKRRRWQLGMLMFVVANIVGSTIQLTTLPLPVLSTLQASGLVFNTISATLILGETFTKNSFIGTVLVCIGAVLIATFGAVGEPAHSLDELLELLDRRPFIVWMVMTGLIVLLVLTGSRVIKILSTSSNSGILHSIHSRALISPSKGKFFRGLSFAFCSGVLSAHTLLLAKSAVELLVRTIVDQVNQFNRWQSWMILIGIIVLALTQLYYMHLSLKLCSTSVLYPFVFCVYNIVAILDGLIYFRQASQLAGLHAGLIALGTVVLLGGVLCLSWRLEDGESHATIAVPNTLQSPLGPGIGIVEECIDSPEEDQEILVGERQPLLSKSPTHETLHQRAPSLPLIPTYRYRAQTVDAQALNNESAQIWAELDDSESEIDGRNRRSTESLSSPAWKRTFQYPRRRTFSLVPESPGQRWSLSGDDARSSLRMPKSRNAPLHHVDSPSALSRWSPRWLQYQRENMGSLRRTSAPVAVSVSRRSDLGKTLISGSAHSSNNHDSESSTSSPFTQNYGTTSSGEQQSSAHHENGQSPFDTTDNDDSNSYNHNNSSNNNRNNNRNLETMLLAGWRRGLRLVQRWAWGRNREEEHSDHPPV